MNAGTNYVDADFYRLVHQLMGDSLREKKLERRGRKRYRFWANQWIAPWDRGAMPSDEAFFEVQCYDLTRGGFSFFLPARPEFDSLVVAFGVPPRMIYLGAEVAHWARVWLHASGEVEKIEEPAAPFTHSGRDGREVRSMVLVGCRFIQRLEDHRLSP